MSSVPVRPVPPRSPHVPSALPSKLFFRIGEVASLVGVEPHVLRYWEREFRSIRPTKSAKGQRVYSRKDVENLLRVRDLLYRDGFTIAGAKKRLQRGPEDGPALDGPAAEVEAAIEHAHEHEREREESAAPSSAFDREIQRLELEDDERAGQDSGDQGRTPMRRKLTALRAEVEAFLGELESGEPA